MDTLDFGKPSWSDGFAEDVVADVDLLHGFFELFNEENSYASSLKLGNENVT